MDRVDELFALPPSDFTRARDALAAELRKAGERDDAKRVKALRRPTVPAWALNRVARDHPQAIAELVAVAGELQRAQQGALSGGDADALRQAMRRRRAVIDAIAAAAVSILREAGTAAGAHVGAIRSTLESAAVDEVLAKEVADGRLVRELEEPSSFNGAGGLRLLQGGLSGGRDAVAPDTTDAELQAARERAQALAAEAATAEELASAAEAEAAVASAEVARLAAALQEASETARHKAIVASAAVQTAAKVRREAERAAAKLPDCS